MSKKLNTKELWIAPILNKDQAEDIIKSMMNAVFFLCVISGISSIAKVLSTIDSPGLIFRIIGALIPTALFLIPCQIVKMKKSRMAAFFLLAFFGVGAVFMTIQAIRAALNVGAPSIVYGILIVATLLFLYLCTWGMVRAFQATIKLNAGFKEIV